MLPERDENARLDALRSLRILDTPATPAFAALVERAAETFACPIALISFLDADRQWFKARHGLTIEATPSSSAFCKHTIEGDDVFVVEDARSDERFKSNPFVTGATGIRFYAGVPIVNAGQRIGALCVKDTTSRGFEETDRERLRQLGKIVEELVLAHGQTVKLETASSLQSRQIHLLRRIQRIAKMGSWELDLGTNNLSCSEEVALIHGLPINTPISLDRALDYYPGSARAQVSACFEAAIATGKNFQLESPFVTAGGKQRWVRVSGDCERRNGGVTRVFGIMQDITAEKDASNRIWRAANFDETTGLANRSRFNRALVSTIERASAACSGIALLVLDLDNFKQFNDNRGYAAGDKILAEIGRRLEALAPDRVARLGGDEFAVMIHGDCSPENIQKCAQSILGCLSEPVRLDATSVGVEATVGSSRFPQDATDAAGLLKAAELALASAKRSHRGSMRLYSAELTSLSQCQGAAVAMVREALANDRLFPFYQPKIRLDTGAIYGFEALARVLHRDGRLLQPRAFVPAFADPATARAIFTRMLDVVVRDLAHWFASNVGHASVSINVSEFDFESGDLAARILRRLDDSGLPRDSLTVEVTESVFLGDSATFAKQALAQLDSAGVKIELDDFGTGFASLTHLRTMPVSRVKIDRSFVVGMAQHEGDCVIVQAVIDLGHKLGCEIVAEGVETEEQAAILRRMGCDAAQGYLYGAAVSGEQTLNRLLKASLGSVSSLVELRARSSAADSEVDEASVTTGALRSFGNVIGLIPR